MPARSTIPATFDSGPPGPGSLTVALDADGAAPLDLPVPGVPPVPTTLTQACPSSVTFNTQAPTTVALTGNLAGAPAGSTVTVTFTHPPRVTKVATVPGPVETVTATTDANGNWSASVTTTDRADIGTWSVSSSYGGATGVGASQAGPCTFAVALPTP